ncbi:T9SS type A sorting domain-containing protein [Chitinophaga lutea]|nr:T9SS type A sorting domain-containing protein [Chitinophaga lutea]
MKAKSTPFLLALLCLFVFHARAQMVSVQNGQLVYLKYANQGQTNADNQVPDFSNAGYRGGGVSLPFIPVVDSIAPVEGNNQAHIQAAIDRVSALPPDASGFRGALLLKAGVYPVDGQLRIRANGVVLRGEGNGREGTVLIATQKTNHNFLYVQGTGSGYGEVAGSKVRITTPFVGTGAKTFAVAAGHTFQPGNKIVVQKTPNDLWIDTLQMRQYGWTASGYKTTYEREVVAVSGNSITIDIPVVDPIETAFGGGEVFKSNITGRIQESGVENLRIESYFLNNDDESHGWIAVVFTRAENCWMRDVIAKYFGYGAASISGQSRFITVQDCAMIDPKSQTTGGRKYSFNLEGNSTSNLYQRCKTWGGRHDLVSGSKVPGPNVFLDCLSDNTRADIGPHHRWSTGQLYDNVYGGQIRVQNRGASGSGHGWAGVQTMFWNVYSYTSDVKVESPIGGLNWGIGAVGKARNGAGYWESWGAHVLPRSLYLAQLQERLGEAAVNNITTPEQRAGRIWDSLLAQTRRIAAEPKVPYFDTDTLNSFDITDNGGIINGQYPNTAKPSENFTSLIDNLITTKYYASGRKALWVEYIAPRKAILSRYTITSGNDVPERDPKNWKLLGSNDGSTWAVLDSQLNQAFDSRRLTRSFPLDTNTTAFQYYRLQITANNGHSGTQFSEWELWERRLQSITFNEVPPITYGDEPFELLAGSNAGLPVTMEVISGPAAFVDSTLVFSGAGDVVVRASQAGNEQYFPATAEITIHVSKAAQTVTFPVIAPRLKHQTATLSATASTGWPVTYSVVSGGGIITDNQIKLTEEGLVMVRATQAGNENYDTASADQSILVLGPGVIKDPIDIKVYPNPTRGPLTVQLQSKKEATYTFRVFDRAGNQVAYAIIPQGQADTYVSLNLSALRHDLYLLHVTDGTDKTVRGILKL